MAFDKWGSELPFSASAKATGLVIRSCPLPESTPASAVSSRKRRTAKDADQVARMRAFKRKKAEAEG